MKVKVRVDVDVCESVIVSEWEEMFLIEGLKPASSYGVNVLTSKHAA